MIFGGAFSQRSATASIPMDSPAASGAVLAAEQGALRIVAVLPDPVGYVSKIDLRYGNYMQMRYNGELERYMSGQSMNYDQFVQNVESALLDPSGGDRGWAIEYDTKVRWARNQERAPRNAVDSGANGPGRAGRPRL